MSCNEHMHHMRIPGYDTPMCVCGQDTATVTHYLLHCPLYTHIRDTTISSIETLFVKNNIPPAYRVINIGTLLGDSNKLIRSVRSAMESQLLGLVLVLGQVPNSSQWVGAQFMPGLLDDNLCKNKQTNNNNTMLISITWILAYTRCCFCLFLHKLTSNKPCIY